ncbi:MAG: ornithine carbamoyltransferase [bacterium]|nr:ornithine carbamoyltransferase [bacterium]
MEIKNHFLCTNDYSADELNYILKAAQALKIMHKKKVPCNYLAGKVLGMIFEKPSNRTRISFEVGMYQSGGKAIYIKASEIGLGAREPVADIARVLSRYLDAVMIRANSHDDIEEMARFSSIPIINGLSDKYHPCQAVADMLTILDFKERLEGINLCYIGDGNNVCSSLIMISSILGINMTVSCPEGYDPVLDDNYKYKLVRNPEQAVTGADVVYTDVWTSMGQEQERSKRLQDFKKYTVTEDLINLADRKAVFMHCLPAHRGEEVTDGVMEGKKSVVFDQAENRMHAQKAILLKLLAPQFIDDISGIVK